MSDELTPDEFAELKHHYGKLFTHPLARLIADHARLLAALADNPTQADMDAAAFESNASYAAGVAAERQRGDTYRARALAMYCRVQEMHEAVDFVFEIKQQAEEELAAEHDRTETWLARERNNGLMLEQARGLLAEACMWLGVSEMPPYTELDIVRRKIDAFLAAAQPAQSAPPVDSVS